MDEVAADIIDRERELADFDHARDDFERAYAGVPAQALDYKPEGDDYSLGYLITHVTASITRYSRLLDDLEAAEYAEVREAAQQPDAVPITTSSNAGEPDVEADPTAGIFEEMELAHDTIAAKMREMAHERYRTQSPVYYSGSTEVYPTSAHDIIGWLIDHYREHIVQVADMLKHRQQDNNR